MVVQRILRRIDAVDPAEYQAQDTSIRIAASGHRGYM
jgi:hypothetical protein